MMITDVCKAQDQWMGMGRVMSTDEHTCTLYRRVRILHPPLVMGKFWLNLRYGELFLKFRLLYGEEHFMAKQRVTLWRTNFMAKRNFRNSVKTPTLWRMSLYGEKACDFMADKLYGEQEFPKFGKNNNFMAEVTLW